DHVGPAGLRAVPLLDDGLDAVADLRARVGADAAFEGALVVVDEEARGHYRRFLALLALEVLERTRDRVRGAGAEQSLVVTGLEARPEVGFRGQRRSQLGRRRVAEIPSVRDVPDPAEALDLQLAQVSFGARPRPIHESPYRRSPKRGRWP